MNDLDLEKMALGEKPVDPADPATAARVAELRAENEEILRAYPPERMAEQIRRRADRKRAARRWLVLTAATSVALAAIGVMPLVQRAIDEPTERTKGMEPHLLAWRRTKGEPEALGPGTVVSRGDTVQLAYVTAGARYGVIVSLDGRGHATLHFPSARDGSTRLSSDPGAVLLEESYELDDAPRFERFFFVTSNEPLDAASVIEATEKLASGRDGGLTGVPIVPGRTRIMAFLLPKSEAL